jgi:hypothetical protein
MNGLQSLMQGAPTQPTQQPQLQQPLQAPATLDQNDPRMAAAMNVVENDVPEPLKEFVDKNDFAQKAIALLQSAGGQAAMDQTPAKPPTIKQRVDQQAMEGVAGLLQRLAPGMQQRGQQVQQAQARKMIGGGMPTMGAPNMARMAMGGIVGYQAGGGVEEQPIMGPPEPNLYQRMGQGLKNYGANAQESMGILKAVKAGIGVPYEERSAVMKQVRDEIAAQNQNRDPNFIERMGQKLMNAGLNVEESKAILKKFYDTFGKTYEEMSNGMAMGGIVGYAGPTGSLVGGMSADEDFTNSNIYMPNELAGKENEDILRRAMEQMNRDPEAEAIAAGERLRGLIGADELMAQRAEKQAALDARREAMFSPEETRRRRISAGLAGLAERGLGGFGAGDTAERDKISAERIASSEASVANMDKLIGELRELGMSQFEAEKQAREMVQKATEQGASTSQAVVDSIQRAQDAAANRATQERGQDITREVGLAQVAVPTDFMNEIQIRVNALQMDNPSLSKIEAQKQALEERIEAQARAQLAANGVRAETLELERLKAAYSMAASRLANNPLAVTDYKAYRRAFDEEVENITAQFMTPSGGNTGAGVPVPSSANDLVVGTVYNTARGPATWNGTSFIPVN